MMIGSGLMLGMGALIVLVAFGLPVLLILALVSGAVGIYRKPNRLAVVAQKTTYTTPGLVLQPVQASMARYCSHCGAGLQADWTHCPQCGAPLGGQA